MRLATATLGLAVLLVAASAAASAKPAFTAKLTAAGHQPHVGSAWRFTVHATNAAGRPVSGTAIVRVYVGGRRVDTVGWFGFKGTLRRTYRWSSRLRGRFAALRVLVKATGATRVLTYAVHVLPSRPLVQRGRFRVRVTGANHRPLAGALWRYTVRAVDFGGHPVDGTAIVRVLVHGRLVDTVGWFGFKGTLHRRYRWSPTLGGRSAVFQARVVGPGGIRSAGYAVRIR